MREWFISSELLGLDGMPNTIVGVSQKARRNNWLKRKASGNGRAFEYHISNFHHDVKKQLVDKYVTDKDEADALLLLGEPSIESMDPALKKKLENELAERSFKSIQAIEKETEDARNEIIAIAAAKKNLEMLVGERKLIHMPNIAESKLIHQLDMCPVAVYNVYAACGWGAENSAEYQIRTEFVPCQWLSRFGLNEDDARIITCQGDSMEDTLSDGDEVLVDTRELEHPVKHGVYVVRIGKHVYIKRLKYDIMAEGYEVISDNKELYPPFIVNGDKLQEFKVIGKVVTTVMKAVV
ncbi:transcriptional regulator [Vibrio sp. HA2012]|uniref:helix-turn-helix domain-containing protein n=1 Tax=Vibrio sp. HA2012 TaxID=1971595 RepID=UPI000C2C2DAD|nr:S24 family peptidase [Vibrio sp. HA2012]PJC85329.1 transcriptional regulator [Vibrio sp. HA2012]